ncbi:hypothetical protein ACI3PL_14440, partial [Lacticaseibacillus paracasei]
MIKRAVNSPNGKNKNKQPAHKQYLLSQGDAAVYNPNSPMNDIKNEITEYYSNEYKLSIIDTQFVPPIKDNN